MKIDSIQYIDELIELNLPRDDFALGGSCPLVIRGLKEKNNDIDIIVTSKLWSELAKKYPITIIDINGEKRELIAIGNIEAILNPAGIGESEDIVGRADTICGYKFVTLDDVITWKEYLNREKDIVDIKLVKENYQN
ncbi:MAG: hypothetical protein FWE47_01825 [Oscillospiraceae bacterium]|nr:hypothetical protein [Oscillospiraceae bacterium]